MNVKGTIKQINDTQVISDKFRKRTLWLTTQDQYPQTIEIQFTQDKCDVLNSYQVGQEVDISINLRGNEWTNKEGVTKMFNTIEGWKINTVSNEPIEEPTPPSEAQLNDDNNPF